MKYTIDDSIRLKEMTLIIDEILKHGKYQFEENLHINSFKELEEIKNSLIDENLFFETKFLSFAKNLVCFFMSNELRENELRIILDLSAIHCGVEDYYEEFGIVDTLIEYVGKQAYEGWDSNSSLVDSYSYTYFFVKSDNILAEKGLDAFINYFITNKFLIGEERNRWIIKSILSNLINASAFKEAELIHIMDKIGVSFFPKSKKLNDFPIVQSRLLNDL